MAALAPKHPATPPVHVRRPPATIVRLGSPRAAIASTDPGRSGLVIAGLAIAAVLFFAVAVTRQGTRFASTGRIVVYHQTKLLAAGVGALVLTLVFFIVGQA